LVSFSLAGEAMNSDEISLGLFETEQAAVEAISQTLTNKSTSERT
jgi:hypothetical protein